MIAYLMVLAGIAAASSVVACVIVVQNKKTLKDINNRTEAFDSFERFLSVSVYDSIVNPERGDLK